MGLLAAKLAPSLHELPPEAISFEIPSQLRKEFSPWWEKRATLLLWQDSHSLTHQVPWIRYIDGKHGTYHTLTRDHFRCKGRGDRAPIALNDGNYLFDCWGREHGLPWIEGREFVEPLLILLLNGVQNELQSPVTIFSGHRCPAHHRYLTQGEGSATDRHLIGAAADFELNGYTQEPQTVVAAIQKVFNKLCNQPKSKLMASQEGWKNYFCEIKWHPAAQFTSPDHPSDRGYFEIIITHRLDLSLVKFVAKESYRLPQF